MQTAEAGWRLWDQVRVYLRDREGWRRGVKAERQRDAKRRGR